MPVLPKLFANKKITLTLILISLTALCIVNITLVWASGDSWASKAPMNKARGYMGVAVVNGRMYAIGGDNGPDVGNVSPGTGRTRNVVSTNEEYNPATDTWALKASMPTPRAGFGVAVYKDKIYCIGGWTYTNEYLNTGVNEVYDTATDTWEIKASMSTTNALLTANVVNGRIHVVPLYDNSVHEVYDPATDSWTTKMPPPHKITSFVSAVVDDKIYFIGRRTDSSGEWTGGSFIQIYDPENDSWRFGASSPADEMTATAGASSDVNSLKRIYFFEETATHIYTPASDSWASGKPMLTARLIARAAAINDKFYVVGGRTGQHGVITWMEPTAVNEQYTPIGYGTQLQPELVYAAAAGAAAITIIVITAVALKKRHKKNTS